MYYLKIFRISFIGFMFWTSLWSYAQNPLITNTYTADPAAHQFSDGRMYLYTDCDPVSKNTDGWNYMNRYKVYSTADLKVWTDHGTLFNCKDISWNDGPAWDGDCVEANGKYWYYFPMVDKIGVAVSDYPTGPFVDALGKPLITRNTPGVKKEAKAWLVSPSILMFGDSVYMYFGQNMELYMAKLKPNMTEIDGPVVSIQRPPYFHEGAWFNYAKGKIHVTYGGNDGEGYDKIGYSTGTSPYGPFEFQYFVQSDQAATVQNCVTEFHGQNFFFYHQDAIDAYHRQICAEKFEYTSEGKIPLIPRTKEGVGSVEMRIDALGKQEAEDYKKSSLGIEINKEPAGEGNEVVNVLGGNTWIMFENVDFGSGVSSFETSLSSALKNEGGEIEIRLDSINGTHVATCKVPQTKGWYNWEKAQCKVTDNAKGVHNLFLVFKGETKKGYYYQLNYMIDYFRFYK